MTLQEVNKAFSTYNTARKFIFGEIQRIAKTLECPKSRSLNEFYSTDKIEINKESVFFMREMGLIENIVYTIPHALFELSNEQLLANKEKYYGEIQTHRIIGY